MILCFATNNAHKLAEVAALLGGAFTLQTLAEIGCTEELPETTGTIPGNSAQKARYVWEHFHVPCFADDTGLEVEALHGEPGVDSAIYAGLPRSDARNRAKLLDALRNVANRGASPRQAQFRCVFTLILPEAVGNVAEHQFEGIVTGTLLHEERGTGGFGYDNLFVPDGHTRTFAEMTAEEKGGLSHRAQALEKMVAFLRQQPI